MKTNATIGPLVAGSIGVSGTFQPPQRSASSNLAVFVAASITGATNADRIIVLACDTKSIDELIDECMDAENLEAGEQPPKQKAIEDLKTLFASAVEASGGEIPLGDVAPYFGELSITWRNENRMLRATTFSDDRRPRIDFGTTPQGSLGDYDFISDPTGAILAGMLNWLYAHEHAS